MKCPVCLTPDLVMADRQGIEIDYCPQCRGVWLDRGELDKIIDRAAPQQPEPQQPEPSFLTPQPQYQPQASGYPQQGYDSRHQHRHHKRKGFLGELFDFG